MKVRQLLAKLATADPESQVVINYDGQCSPISTTMSHGVYIPQNDYFGNSYAENNSKYEEHKNNEQAEPATIFYVNRC